VHGTIGITITNSGANEASFIRGDASGDLTVNVGDAVAILLHPADLIAYTYTKSFDLPVVITRCGNFYGGGDLNWNRIIPGTIRSILREQRPIIRSDGNYIRDYFYVEDGAAAYMLLAEQLAMRPDLKGQAYNFSNEIQVSVREIVEHILKAMDSSLTPNIHNETSNEIRHQYLNAQKARRELKWEPMFTLEEGLIRTIDWYKDFFNE
jgi:CDP-glucose 4,6-dehydratase